jgi:WD40 repeat protein
VRLWDAATGAALAVLPHGSVVYGVAFHPGGTRLAAACADNTIRLWDVGVARQAGGKEAADAEVAELRGHDAYVHAVDWSPDGTRLVSASGDGTVRVWDSLPPAVRAQPPDAAGPARHLLHRIYHAQRAFRKEHGRYAGSLAELKLADLPDATLEAQAERFRASMAVKLPAGGRRRWHIREDSLVWSDP